MTMPAITFGNAQRATRDLLRYALAARSEPYVDGVTVGVKVPKHSDNLPALPYVVVRTDGSYRDTRLNGRAIVRVTVWHRDEGLALDLAGLCEALLLSGSSSEVRNFGPVNGPLPTTDPDFGTPIAFFSVTARMSPIQLT